jgi:hypothetical protein
MQWLDNLNNKSHVNEKDEEKNRVEDLSSNIWMVS